MADPKTRNDLINDAYGILATTGTPPETEDAATIGAYVDPLIDQLSADNIITVDADAIPNEVFMPLVRLLANVSGPKYGSPMNEDAKLVDERTLRRLNASKPTYEIMQVEYF